MSSAYGRKLVSAQLTRRSTPRVDPTTFRGPISNVFFRERARAFSSRLSQKATCFLLLATSCVNVHVSTNAIHAELTTNG